MHLLEIFLYSGVIITIHPALCVWITMVLILSSDKGTKCQAITTSPLNREAGTFGLSAHLRKRGQKPGILRQVGEG